jgi:hypothetical protein
MIENECFRTSNKVGNFDYENQRFSISLFSRLITLVLFQVIISLIMRTIFSLKKNKNLRSNIKTYYIGFISSSYKSYYEKFIAIEVKLSIAMN